MKYPQVENGTKVGDQTVLAYAGHDTHGHPLVSVRCDAGHEKEMVWSDLASGRHKKCKICVATTHGLAGTLEYQSAYDAVSRCEDPKDVNYHTYSTRGIKVEFPGSTIAEKAAAMAKYLVEHVGRRPSRRHVLDRINNDGNYTPGNLRWSLIPNSLRNRSVNRRITFVGLTLCLCDWAKITGLDRSTISQRLDAGDPTWLAMTLVSDYKRLKREWKKGMKAETGGTMNSAQSDIAVDQSNTKPIAKPQGKAKAKKAAPKPRQNSYDRARQRGMRDGLERGLRDGYKQGFTNGLNEGYARCLADVQRSKRTWWQRFVEFFQAQ